MRYELALERMTVNRLLLEEARAKRACGELMEALELRAEAEACEREALALLGRATPAAPPHDLIR